MLCCVRLSCVTAHQDKAVSNNCGHGKTTSHHIPRWQDRTATMVALQHLLSRPARATHRECFAMTKEKRMKSGRAIRVNGGRSDDKKMQDFDSVFIASPTNRVCFEAEQQLDHCPTWLVHSTSVGRQALSSLKAGRWVPAVFHLQCLQSTSCSKSSKQTAPDCSKSFGTNSPRL